jgi:hypothetical protein
MFSKVYIALAGSVGVPVGVSGSPAKAATASIMLITGTAIAHTDDFNTFLMVFLLYVDCQSETEKTPTALLCQQENNRR